MTNLDFPITFTGSIAIPVFNGINCVKMLLEREGVEYNEKWGKEDQRMLTKYVAANNLLRAIHVRRKIPKDATKVNKITLHYGTLYWKRGKLQRGGNVGQMHPILYIVVPQIFPKS